jgi:hypothetical protein
MPVDYTPLLIAVAVWIAGTLWALHRLRGSSAEQPGAGMPHVRIALGTAFASAAFAVLGYFTIWFYEWLHGRA